MSGPQKTFATGIAVPAHLKVPCSKLTWQWLVYRMACFFPTPFPPWFNDNPEVLPLYFSTVARLDFLGGNLVLKHPRCKHFDSKWGDHVAVATSQGGKLKIPEAKHVIHSLKLTVSPLKIGQNWPKRKRSSEPTIHFQVRFVSFREGNPGSFGITHSNCLNNFGASRGKKASSPWL